MTTRFSIALLRTRPVGRKGGPKTMKSKCVLASCVLFFAPWSHALDLVDALQRAKVNDPNWQANLLQYEADQLNLGIAQGNLLPTISLSGNVTRKNQPIGQVSSVLSMPDTTTTKQVAITARQPLFRWDAWEGLKQVKTSLNLQEEQALLEQLNMMNAKLREGLVAKSDVSEANAQYQSAQANRIATHVQLVLAQEQLAQIIGPYQENLAVLREDFQFQKPYPAELSAWTNLALAQNLGIQQARLQQRYAEDQKRVEQAALYPQIEAVGSYGYSEQTPENIMSAKGNFDQIGIEMNWNVYTGGRTKKSIQKAAVNVKKSEAELDAAIRKANTEVKKSYLQVETDQAKLQARKAAMESSSLVSRASQAQYQEGLKTMVDVLLAQRNAFSTKQDYVNAKYDYLINVLHLKASVGKLTEQDIQEMNAWLVDKARL